LAALAAVVVTAVAALLAVTSAPAAADVSGCANAFAYDPYGTDPQPPYNIGFVGIADLIDCSVGVDITFSFVETSTPFPRIINTLRTHFEPPGSWGGSIGAPCTYDIFDYHEYRTELTLQRGGQYGHVWSSSIYVPYFCYRP